ncbi:N-acetylglucosaminyltransferase [Cadophora gregata]|uniref:N-acetylglucosaminyltransferase n=1 Tax=Cadophora gregata TaxID=51156 RepID=UPI0026DC5391|nr:N-acetylglucosaminyltransferase [Cadophora gregata]KAK0101441.1 N-acetylglucosaminyltransferase [Cadophora gregata]KAK0106548.1 N-acetylglucosaminyltransferase [Cadophora gregata f. sp. sojae]
MPKDKEHHPFATNGRPMPRPLRRIQRITATPTFKLVALIIFLLLGIRWLLDHNHDRHDWPGPVRPTMSVESLWIQWDDKQYIQIVADEEKLCSAVLTWHDIEEIGSRARRTLVYPSTWSPDEVETDPALNNTLTRKAHLLREARDKYFARLHPIDALKENVADRGRWADQYIKLIAFNLTEFSRVLVLDSASQARGNLDSVFLLPKAKLAMPWVYWGEPTGWAFSNQMMLITPSANEFARIQAEIEKADPDQYDLTIVEKLYKSKTLKIPQRPYHLMTGEFRRQDHSKYRGSSKKWDPEAELHNSKMIHFSDWPIPRPWDSAPQSMLNKHMPKCLKSEWFGATNCKDRMIWMQLYADYAAKRKGFCGSHFEVKVRDQEADAMLRHGRFFHDETT